jgi:hypothetical protein
MLALGRDAKVTDAEVNGLDAIILLRERPVAFVRGGKLVAQRAVRAGGAVAGRLDCSGCGDGTFVRSWPTGIRTLRPNPPGIPRGTDLERSDSSGQSSHVFW